MGNILDIFNNDVFGLSSLSRAIQKLPYKPGRVGEMGLFDTQGVTTHTVAIEEQDGVLALLATGTRGAVKPPVAKNEKRRVRVFQVPHIPYDDVLLAASIQGVRSFGTETQLETVSQIVNNKLEQMRSHHELTHEYHRIGAVQGKVYDADGSTVLTDLFEEYNIVRTTVDFALSSISTDIRKKCLDVIRGVEAALGNAPYDRIHCLCGKNFFDAFIGHEYVKDAYHRYQDSVNLRNDPRKGFEFGGITFEEYRGKIGSVSFVNDDEANFFPLGVSNLFVSFFGPADFIETVNTIGQPIYAKQERLAMDKGIHIHTQSNPLMMCLRPSVLLRGTL